MRDISMVKLMVIATRNAKNRLGWRTWFTKTNVCTMRATVNPLKRNLAVWIDGFVRVYKRPITKNGILFSRSFWWHLKVKIEINQVNFVFITIVLANAEIYRPSNSLYHWVWWFNFFWQSLAFIILWPWVALKDSTFSV